MEIIDDESDSVDEDNMKYRTLAERVKLYSETVVRNDKEEKLFTFRKITRNQVEEPVVIVLQNAFQVGRPNLYGVKVELQITEYPKRHYILELEDNEKAISLYSRLKQYTRNPDRRFLVSDDVREYM